MGSAISSLNEGGDGGQILVIGLDNSGKSSVLYALNLGPVSIEPIKGIDVEIVQHGNITVTSWTLNSDTSIAGPWRKYYSRNTLGIIFVIDSCDSERFCQCCHELRRMLDEKELETAALLVFANKQDVRGAKSVDEISEALNLSAITERKWKIQGCSATSREGIDEGLHWLSSAIKSAR